MDLEKAEIENTEKDGVQRKVPTEIVFDQGLGDMFVVRVAGNCLATPGVYFYLYLAEEKAAAHHGSLRSLLQNLFKGYTAFCEKKSIIEI